MTSGHYAKYGKDAFQPIHTPEEGEEYFLKPMHCPHHCGIYKNFPRSYKDLPLRIAEFGTVCRYEQSGESVSYTHLYKTGVTRSCWLISHLSMIRCSFWDTGGVELHLYIMCSLVTSILGITTETTSATYRRTQTHESQSFSTELPESKGTDNEQLML